MLEVHLLGPFRLVSGRRELAAFPTRAAKLLFSYLVLHRTRRHPRELLASLLAGNSPDRVARRKLRQELWRIRATLAQDEGRAADLVEADGQRIGIDANAQLWVDTEEFERALRRADACDPDDERVGALFEVAYELYTGALLEGEYAGWCLIEQDRFRAMHHEAAGRLVAWHANRGAWPRALQRARDVLRYDPLAERVHRQIIALRFLAGDRPGALRQYAECRRILDCELSVEPMASTTNLVEAVRGGDRSAALRALGLSTDRIPANLPSRVEARSPSTRRDRRTPETAPGT